MLILMTHPQPSNDDLQIGESREFWRPARLMKSAWATCSGAGSLGVRPLIAAAFALGSCVLTPRSADAATNSDGFVYAGTQSDLVNGAVITVSTAGNQLAMCVNVPSGDEPKDRKSTRLNSSH